MRMCVWWTVFACRVVRIRACHCGAPFSLVYAFVSVVSQCVFVSVVRVFVSVVRVCVSVVCVFVSVVSVCVCHCGVCFF